MRVILKVIVGIVLSLIILAGAAFLYLDYKWSGALESSDLPRSFRSSDNYGNHLFTIYFQEPPMSFGSGHKILTLKDTSTDKILDEIKFGEHPLTITWITKDSIFLKIPDSEYAKSWCSQNDIIGQYNVICTVQ